MEICDQIDESEKRTLYFEQKYGFKLESEVTIIRMNNCELNVVRF